MMPQGPDIYHTVASVVGECPYIRSFIININMREIHLDPEVCPHWLAEWVRIGIREYVTHF